MSTNLSLDVRPLFQPLQQRLITLLNSLRPEDWHKQTVAKQWKVKDVVSHLLDGDLRVLSIQRDRYYGNTPPNSTDYQTMVDWLNQLNADWVSASKRLSPEVLILMHKTTGPLVSQYFENLDPNDKAIFSVDWAGESDSLNWMHVAREYTERWHHQQQIRDAVGLEGIMTRQFFFPMIDTFFRALPYTFRKVEATLGTIIEAKIPSEIGGSWYLQKENDAWSLVSGHQIVPDVQVEIPVDISWKLFSKSLRPSEVLEKIIINGNRTLGKKVLEMVSVMA
ncbi:MAG: maleylpyruvate isomerase N-terminal domain-containing protein [Reichenbachiella sp.]|uniref:maleylpyruvate isomerase N-terminal domain-containing protein n=1 Tax=Reichenbachiella sp. TaxID=2184521 RepID=UPI003266F60B